MASRRAQIILAAGGLKHAEMNKRRNEWNGTKWAVNMLMWKCAELLIKNYEALLKFQNANMVQWNEWGAIEWSLLKGHRSCREEWGGTASSMTACEATRRALQLQPALKIKVCCCCNGLANYLLTTNDEHRFTGFISDGTNRLLANRICFKNQLENKLNLQSDHWW